VGHCVNDGEVAVFARHRSKPTRREEVSLRRREPTAHPSSITQTARPGRKAALLFRFNYSFAARLRRWTTVFLTPESRHAEPVRNAPLAPTLYSVRTTAEALRCPVSPVYCLTPCLLDTRVIIAPSTSGGERRMSREICRPRLSRFRHGEHTPI
jgi:hypothetical protein